MRRTGRRRTGATREVRELVVERDGRRCVCCGAWVPGMPGSIHHRTPRGMGGTRDPKVNLPANLLLLCGSGTTGCHGWVEANRERARELGYLVSWWEHASDIPVVYWDGVSYLLDQTGERLALQ